MRRHISSAQQTGKDAPKPAPSDPQYLLQLEDIGEAALSYILQQMKSQSLICQVMEYGKDRFITVTADSNALLKQVSYSQHHSDSLVCPDSLCTYVFLMAILIGRKAEVGETSEELWRGLSITIVLRLLECIIYLNLNLMESIATTGSSES